MKFPSRTRAKRHRAVSRRGSGQNQKRKAYLMTTATLLPASCTNTFARQCRRSTGKRAAQPEEERREDRAGVPVEHARAEGAPAHMLAGLGEEERALREGEQSQRRPDAEDREGVQCGATMRGAEGEVLGG